MFNDFPLPDLTPLPDLPTLIPLPDFGNNSFFSSTKTKSSKSERSFLSNNVSPDIDKLFDFKYEKKADVFNKNIVVRRSKLKDEYEVYPILQIGTLIENIKREKKGKNTIRLRFNLNSNNQLMIAREGSPRATIPAHEQMSHNYPDNPESYSSGNFMIDVFEDGTYCLATINNKSGAFEQSYQSIRFTLEVLLACKNVLPNKFIGETIRIQNTNAGGFVWENEYSVLELESLLEVNKLKIEEQKLQIVYGKEHPKFKSTQSVYIPTPVATLDSDPLSRPPKRKLRQFLNGNQQFFLEANNQMVANFNEFVPSAKKAKVEQESENKISIIKGI